MVGESRWGEAVGLSQAELRTAFQDSSSHTWPKLLIGLVIKWESAIKTLQRRNQEIGHELTLHPKKFHQKEVEQAVMSFIVFRVQVWNVSTDLDAWVRARKQGGLSLLQCGKATLSESFLFGNKAPIQLPKIKGGFLLFLNPLKQMIGGRFELIDSHGYKALVTSACH